MRALPSRYRASVLGTHRRPGLAAGGYRGLVGGSRGSADRTNRVPRERGDWLLGAAQGDAPEAAGLVESLPQHEVHGIRLPRARSLSDSRSLPGPRFPSCEHSRSRRPALGGRAEGRSRHRHFRGSPLPGWGAPTSKGSTDVSPKDVRRKITLKPGQRPVALECRGLARSHRGPVRRGRVPECPRPVGSRYSAGTRHRSSSGSARGFSTAFDPRSSTRRVAGSARPIQWCFAAKSS